jgi:multidrug efflux system outer membrane protein
MFGPKVKWNLFSAGRNQARLDAANATATAAAVQYRATVDRALEEVESSLVRYGAAARSLQLLTAAVDSREREVDIQRLRRESGLADAMGVVNARAAWLNASWNRLNQEEILLTRLVALYKALGGGWERIPKSEGYNP